MPATFSRSLRALRADNSRRTTIALLVAALVLTSWVAWMTLAEISVFAVADSARLEVDQSVHRVATHTGGRVATVHLELGKMVEKGDVLVQLDAGQQQLKLEEARARLHALEPELIPLQAEIRASRKGGTQARGAGHASVREARAELRKADVAARLAAEEVKRLEPQEKAGAVSTAELSRSRATLAQRRAVSDSLRHKLRRLSLEHGTSDSQNRARIEQLNRSVARLQGQAITIQAEIKRLEHDVTLRNIRAPVAGRLGDVSDLKLGGVVAAGDTIATIIPGGDLQIVARYRPSVAVGRVVQGQAARFRLTGFSWTQYGSLHAVVKKVASEPRDGSIRVELEAAAASFPVPLEHGMSGSLEVEVERVSPATLVLRAAGKQYSGSE